MTEREVLDALKAVIAETGPMTIDELVEATGMKKNDIRTAMNRGLTKLGGVSSTGRRGRSRLYGLLGAFDSPKPNLPKPYVHQFKPLTKADHDPFAHRNLAMLTREKVKP
jgi:hypothetical protein